MIKENTNNQVMFAKTIVDELEIYIMNNEDRWLYNNDSTFWMTDSDITCSA